MQVYRRKWVIHVERITREKVNGERSGMLALLWVAGAWPDQLATGPQRRRVCAALARGFAGGPESNHVRLLREQVRL